MNKLFAFYLGGSIEGCNIEMHDLKFCVGEKVEDCYSQLKSSWIGSPIKLHIDSYCVLEQVDGHDIIISPKNTSKNRPLS